jgi:hypothetical protein
MLELLSRMQPGELIGLTAVGGGILIGLIATVMGIGLAHRRIELNAALKKNMLDRGMSAEEIRIVMEAGSSCPDRPIKERAYAEV